MAFCSQCGSKLPFFRSSVYVEGIGEFCSKCTASRDEKRNLLVSINDSEKIFQDYITNITDISSAEDGPLIWVALGIGYNIELFRKKIRIKKGNVMSQITGSIETDKEIWIDNISSIQFVKPVFGTNGHIQFSLIGGHGGDLEFIEAAKTGHIVVFQSRDEQSFVKMKQLIEECMSSNKEEKQTTR